MTPDSIPIQKRAALGAALFLTVFVFYLQTLSSSIYLDDSGETATLAWTLSIGHPPGYPLHTLLHRTACILPLGDAGWRLAAASAFWFSLTAGLLGFWVLSLTRNFWLAILAAIAIGLGPAFWRQALIAKGSVYGLNNAITLAEILVLTLVMREKQRYAAFWLLLGLGAAHHYMSQLVLAPAFFILARQGKPLAWRLWLRQSWLLLPGLTLYAYFPLRSASSPPVHWGEFNSLGDFFFYFLRAQYAAAEGTRSLAGSWQQLREALGYLLREGHYVALPLAAWAAWHGRRDAWVNALVLGVLAPLLAVTFYLNLAAERLEIMEPYLFPAYLCQGLLAAWLFSKLPKKWSPAFLIICSAGLLTVGATQFSKRDRSQYFMALDRARDVLAALPRNSVLYTSGDASVFPLWYAQFVKGERRDVAIVGVPLLPMRWVREDLARRFPAMRLPWVDTRAGNESTPAILEALLRLNAEKPQFFTYNELPKELNGWRLLPAGQIYQPLVLAAAAPKDWLQRGRHNLALVRKRGYRDPKLDVNSRKLMVNDFAIFHNSLGTLAEESGALADALKLYEDAEVWDASSHEFPYNRGNALHRMGRMQEAELAYRQSLSNKPGYIDAWYNLGVTYFKTGRPAEGRQAFQKVLELDPSRADVRRILN